MSVKVPNYWSYSSVILVFTFLVFVVTLFVNVQALEWPTILFIGALGLHMAVPKKENKRG